MNYTRLENLGWTKKEISHVKTIFKKAEKKKLPFLHWLEHGMLWLVVISLIMGSVALSVFLLPLFLFSSLFVSVPIVFLLSTCFGLMFVHVLHDLKLESVHHIGTGVLIIGMFLSVSTTLRMVPGLDMSPSNVSILAIAFSTGILIPYVAHWRITHATG